MGLSASQSRLLALTSRMTDLEFRSEQISNEKVRLSNESSAASRTYTEALSKQIMKVYSGVTSEGDAEYADATAYNLTHYDSNTAISDIQRFIKNESGSIVVDRKIANAYNNSGGNVNSFTALLGCASTAEKAYYANIFGEIVEAAGGAWSPGKGYNEVSDDNLNSSEWLEAQINNGTIYLYEYGSTSETTMDVQLKSWTSGDNNLEFETDDATTAKAEADYEAAQAEIKSKDERYDLELKNIDTEHSSIQSELESVQKVIEKNIENSLKIFDA